MVFDLIAPSLDVILWLVVIDNSRKRNADNSINYHNCKAYILAHGRYRNAAETTFEYLRDVEGDREHKRL